MRNLIIALLLLFTSVAASAQFNKGRMLVGGTLGFKASTFKTESSGNTTVDGKQNEFTFNPQFGYFIINNLAVGAGINATLTKFKSDRNTGYEYTSTSFQIAPFVRYYIKPGVFFQGTYGIGPQKTKYGASGNQSELKATNNSWSLACGYALFLNDHVAIEPMFGYGMSSTKYKETEDTIEYKSKSSGLFLRVGFQVYLGDR